MMSNFKIVHEIDGRLRVRFGQYAFTNEQATILKSDFLKLEYVRYVEAHYKNGSLLLVFDENYKNEVTYKRHPCKERGVIKMDLSGNVLCEYSSINEAARLNNSSTGNIWATCNGMYKTYHGFKWAFK